MREPLPFGGDILAATVSLEAARWHIAFQVDTGEAPLSPQPPCDCDDPDPASGCLRLDTGSERRASRGKDAALRTASPVDPSGKTTDSTASVPLIAQ